MIEEPPLLDEIEFRDLVLAAIALFEPVSYDDECICTFHLGGEGPPPHAGGRYDMLSRREAQMMADELRRTFPHPGFFEVRTSRFTVESARNPMPVR